MNFMYDSSQAAELSYDMEEIYREAWEDGCYGFYDRYLSQLVSDGEVIFNINQSEIGKWLSEVSS